MKVRLVALVLMVASCGGNDTKCETCLDGMGADACCLDGGTDSGTDGSTDGSTDAPFTCDPVHQTGCPSGKACYSDLYNDPQGLANLTYFCATPGAGTEATTCATDADCASGFWCVKSGINKCTRFCDTAAQCSTTSPSCLYDQNMQYPFGYCACVNPPGIGTCP